MVTRVGVVPSALDSVDARSRVARGAITNAFTVDVEDYFQVSALAPQIDRATWDEQPCRVERTRSRLSSPGATTSLHPRMDCKAVSAGREIAGGMSARVSISARRDQRFGVCQTCHKRLLEDIAAQPALGYRAPDFRSATKTCGRLMAPSRIIGTARASIL
jgi:hypothetical protein